MAAACQHVALPVCCQDRPKGPEHVPLSVEDMHQAERMSKVNRAKRKAEEAGEEYDPTAAKKKMEALEAMMGADEWGGQGVRKQNYHHIAIMQRAAATLPPCCSHVAAMLPQGCCTVCHNGAAMLPP